MTCPIALILISTGYVHTLLFSSLANYLNPLQVGRAGRFGTKGLAITFVSSQEDSDVLNAVQGRFEVNITELPPKVEVSAYSTCQSSPGLPAFHPLCVVVLTELLSIPLKVAS